MSPSAISESYKIIALSYDTEDSDASARRLISALKPEWDDSPGPVDFVKFKEGITNTLLKAIKKRPGYTEHQIDDEAVLLRAYGSGTAVIIDREREARAHSLLAKHNLAPELLARFENGLLYKFIEGFACSPEDLRKPEIWPATARRLGQWHATLPIADAIAAVEPSDRKWTNINEMLPGKPIPNVWSVLQKWIKALPSNSSEEQARNATLQTELEAIVKSHGNPEGLSSGQYILSHCDLLSGNVIVHPKSKQSHNDEDEVSFIDYEYATPGPAAFDLANHFAEWGGFECDYTVLPTRSQRLGFIKQYVASFRLHSRPSNGGTSNGSATNDPTNNGTTNGHKQQSTEEEDVERLMSEVDAFRGIPGFYWAIWGWIQAMISDIDFDYASYAPTRLGEYWAWKASSEGHQKGKEIPLRERRWAEN